MAKRYTKSALECNRDRSRQEARPVIMAAFDRKGGAHSRRKGRKGYNRRAGKVALRRECT